MNYERPIDKLEKEVARKQAINAAMDAGTEELRRLKGDKISWKKIAYDQMDKVAMIAIQRDDLQAENDRLRAELAGLELMDREADDFLAGKVVVDKTEYENLEAENSRLTVELRKANMALAAMQAGGSAEDYA